MKTARYDGVDGLKAAQKRARELVAESISGFDDADFTELYDDATGLDACYGPGGPASATSWRDQNYSQEATVDAATAERFLEHIKARWEEMGVEFEESNPLPDDPAPITDLYGNADPFSLVAEAQPSAGTISVLATTPCIELPSGAIDANGQLTGE